MIIPETETSESSDSQGIPDWIKNNAGWWADGQIDDNTFVQGIQFLIKAGIIVVNDNWKNYSNSETYVGISLSRCDSLHVHCSDDSPQSKQTNRFPLL